LKDEQFASLGLMPLVERAFRGERVVLPEFEYDAGPAFEAAGLPVAGAKKRWVRTHLYPVLDANGQVMNVVDVEEDVTEAKAAELQLANYQDRLRALGHDLTVSEEGERRRIASELHDNAAQSLALARLQLVKAAKAVTDTRAAGQLDQVSQLLRDSLQQIRDLVLDLSSPALSEIGLGAAIAEWLENHQRRSPGLQFSFNNGCSDLEIDEVVGAVLFRNTRELLANVVKHAGAGLVEVRLDCQGDEFQVIVTDDGRGFSPTEVAQRPTSEGSFGLFSIRERMADLGGRLDLDSAPGRGCTAVLRMPQDRLTAKE
jgi:signal transduction histidine kinase